MKTFLCILCMFIIFNTAWGKRCDSELRSCACPGDKGGNHSGDCYQMGPNKNTHVCGCHRLGIKSGRVR